MNTGNAIYDNQANNSFPDPGINMNSLVVELEHYRRQSEWLSLVNELHGRLAGAVDLPTMLEAFSVWLMPLVAHDLMAYKDSDRDRLHMLCSCHGPERRKIIDIANDFFATHPSCDDSCSWDIEEYYIQKWPLKKLNGRGIIVLLRKDRKIGEYENQLLEKGLKILSEPLQRTLEYEDLYEQASRDTLTGLSNRRVFEERIGPVMAQARRHGHPVTMACMDLDKFKLINDSFGHPVGDLVLQKVSATMEQMVRSCDVLARMGGDEFMLIMPDTNLESAEILANRLCDAIKELELPNLGSGSIGVSIGLTEWQQELDKAQWIQKADEALYKAKSNGRSRVYSL